MLTESIKALLVGYGHLIPYAYFATVSLIAMIMTVYDKRAAKRQNGKRVPELRLWTVAILGGSVMMYTVMRIIHHKTKHRSFMIGLPIIIVVQFVAAFTLLICF